MESAISAESQRIQQSVGIIQGSIASSTVSVADVQQPTEVELLSSPACCCTASQQDTREASVSGRVLIEGVLHGRAMVSKKDSLAAAVDFLKVSTWNNILVFMCLYLFDIVMHAKCRLSCANRVLGDIYQRPKVMIALQPIESATRLHLLLWHCTSVGSG